ncbi:hypothetical protein CUMW_270350 [Citrus unshiu]|uniref:Uncharacterized protein n=1 Tax=Citrus unshiu TaxID=55188 RepID=A0A2H5QX85_CITUN|nr:hypothetical protein CUMW_270350 [Citrus unshiu]
MAVKRHIQFGDKMLLQFCKHLVLRRFCPHEMLKSDLQGFEEVFAVNFPPRAIAAKRHIHFSNLVSDLQGRLLLRRLSPHDEML